MLDDDINLHQLGAADFLNSKEKMTYQEWLEFTEYGDELLSRMTYAAYCYGYDKSAKGGL